ncbi:MAG: AAA family ATPase, partial [Propionibacteriaceae bacterium]|nr:AAA family ATPase [Propionibacteriaceae bacterium]
MTDLQPPHNRDAELALVAAAWQHPNLTTTLGVHPTDLYGTDTEALWHALTTLHTEGVTPDPVLVLKRIPKQLRAPVNQLLIEHIITGYTIPANAPAYAAEIQTLADRRHLLTATDRLRQTLTNPDATAEQISDTLTQLAQPARITDSDWRTGLTPGGTFILDTPDDIPPLWGTGGRSLWAPGEALIIAGPQGTGKTTIAQQLGLGRIGFPEYANLLDLPITPGDQNLLYLAMDRPAQARRSLRRMVGETWHTELNQRLTVWPGPPPKDLARNPNLLTEMCQAAGADTCIVDSLKDAFLGLTDDEQAAAWNRARQTALREGIQLVELHHNRKPAAGVKSDGPTISDVYGSTWITSGAGSVILLNGHPGDPIIKLHHLKQPAEEVGPLSIVHDHDLGRSTI